MRRGPAALLSILILASGCVGAAEETDAPAAARDAGALEAPLWPDPQHVPHPAYGWPTLTHVPPDAPAWWRPTAGEVAYADAAGSMEHLARLETIGTSGDGIAVFGRIAVIPGLQFDPLVEIVDLTYPSAPVVLSSFVPQMHGRSVNLLPYPDGRLVAVLVADSPHLQLWDITDPLAPEELAIIDLPSGAHNVGIVPGTPILYNANSVGTLVNPLFFLAGGTSIPQVEIYDLTDPAAPALVQEWANGLGCHAISFHTADPTKLRGYCAGLDRVQVWDIADPLAPTVVSDFPFTHGLRPLPGNVGLVSVAHTPIANRDATVLAVTDETLGGGTAYCDAHLEPIDRSGPLGNVWFYDISEETSPRLAGWIGVDTTVLDDPEGWCLAHVGHLVPHPERDLAAVAFYSAGVGLIDFTDPEAPFFADQWISDREPRAEPTDVWYVHGHLVTGDRQGGLDVLALR